MWRLDNKTEFPVKSMFYTDKAGISHWVIVCKISWDMNSEIIKLADEQQAIRFIDEYIDNDFSQAVNYGNDLTPLKNKTDIIIKGHAYLPFSEGNYFDISLSFGIIEKVLRIRKERYLMKTLMGTRIVEGDFPEKISLGYENAFGGKYKTDKEERIFSYNPAGKGYTNIKLVGSEKVYLPLLEYPEAPYNNRKGEIPPAALGYISPFWETRRIYAGTYDQKWLDDKYPFYPDDFSNQFWQQAAEDQQYPGEIYGNEKLRLTNMTKGGNHINTLPENRELYPFEIKSIIKGKSSNHKYKINTLLIEPDDMTISTVYAAEMAYDPDMDDDIIVTINQLLDESKRC
ncbi:MAG: DUF2169 domain-containing protein [Candidatus Cloacimonetes bacterium]|nr:DUF2169 domain-containing protein [Candidatus Cloacimonadota bacterium]